MAVFMDPELTVHAWSKTEFVRNWQDPSIPAGHSRLYIRPDPIFNGSVWGSYHDLFTFERLTLEGSGDFYLYENDSVGNWGALQQFYLALLVDPVTAEPLEKPIVTIFTLENQLEAPQSEFFITEDGRGGFRWEEVEGADYYLVVRMQAEIRSSFVMYPIDKVTGTEWIHPLHPDDLHMNWVLRDHGFREENYSVIAVNSEAHSPVGTIHNGKEIASRLPSHWDWFTEQLDSMGLDGTITFFVRSLGLIPTHRPIIAANGESVQRRMIYDFDNAVLGTAIYLFFEEGPDGERLNPWETRESLHIPFIIEGTIFAGAIAAEIDIDTYADELKDIREKIESAAPRGGGNTKIDIVNQTPEDAYNVEDTPSQEAESAMILFRADDHVFANTAFSAYLARNMLAANEIIDLSFFPESADWNHLLDAFFEALYQNPLIMHVESVSSIPGSDVLVVEYRESINKIFEQQAALRYIVPIIVAETISPDMTPLEKSFAINNYLIENSAYDLAALENAERSNFQTVDARFNDSFTAYGILINKIGVCAGYADAFKLLAVEAGLDAIVVTGYLEGILPHAWNRVNIDGHWHTVDVTNNANEFLLNAFLNLPDNAAGRMLIEDNQFMMNDFIAAYRSTNSTSEYYYVTNRFFDRGEVAQELARLIRRDGSGTVRTDFGLTEESFNLIAMEVMSILGTKNIFGLHMLGVIWMSDSAG